MASHELCIICDISLKLADVRTVKKRGIQTLIENSTKRKDNKWLQLQALEEIVLHKKCYLSYIDERVAKPDAGMQKVIRIRQSSCSGSTFNYEENCLLCDKKWIPRLKGGCIIESESTKEKLLRIANSRNDALGQAVKQRIEHAPSLRDVRARYHRKCYWLFISPSEKKAGRPPIKNLQTAFDAVCHYIETSNDCQFTLTELMDVMTDYTPKRETLVTKLVEKYKNDIIVVTKPGKETVICFKDTEHNVLLDSWYEERAATEKEERIRIVKAAAAIIRSDIRSKIYDTKMYPASHNFLDSVVEDVPETLQILLDEIILRGKKQRRTLGVKRNSIAHAIVSATRPASFTSSIQLATGTYLHRMSGSKPVVDVLSRLGFSASYNDVLLYEASAIMHPQTAIIPGTFVQYVFDNADHNVCTIDGLNTFHSMGGIYSITPESGLSAETPVKKYSSMPSAKTLASQGTIDIIPLESFHKPEMKNLTFVDVAQLNLGERIPVTLPVSYGAFLWAKTFEVDGLPSWREYMETITSTMPYQVSRVICCPFITQSPSNPETVNSALHYAVQQCKKAKQKTVFVTFDQPLYMEARKIVADTDSIELKNVRVRLGGFHLLMSFLKAIGHVMEGSGIEELWSTLYARVTVDKMLAGHAFSRALRAHLLTYTALGIIVAGTIEDLEENDRLYVTQLFKTFTSDPPLLEELKNDHRLTNLTHRFTDALEALKSNGPTAQLWIQYFECITIVMQFVEAERLGDWNLHLRTVRKMLPLFHAAGLIAYAKSAQIYLQDMADLERSMDPLEFHKFSVQGYFTIRRSDKKWAGIWSDMTIEQTLMRLMKLGRGFTHGQGVAPSVLARYIQGMPRAYGIMEQLEFFCQSRSESVDQHTDIRESRVNRDEKDIATLRGWLLIRNPFEQREKLMSLSTGMVASIDVNCHLAIAVGKGSMTLMVGKDAETIKMSRSRRVKTLASTKNGLTINNEHVPIDTSLLCQRIAAMITDDEDLASEALRYELAPVPLALFDESGLMRKAQKSQLFEIFQSSPLDDAILSNCKYVIDGEFLLRKVVWGCGQTYEQICCEYEIFVKKHFTGNPIVVFNEYSDENFGVKSYERYRRSSKNVGVQTKFTSDMIATLDQSKFLGNDKNKARFVELLKSHFENSGIAVEQAEEDVDRLIVTTAIEESHHHANVVVVGTDVDLIVLLIGLTPQGKDVYFLKDGQGKNGSTLFSTANHESLKDNILFSHAFGGCDTTSALFNKSKKAILSVLQNKIDLGKAVRAFYNPASTPNDIANQGERIMLAIYGALDAGKRLNRLRSQRFISSENTAKAEVRLAMLPPTSSATHQHAFRVFYQVQRWLGNAALPCDWGWKKTEMLYLPVTNTEPPAPSKLLDTMFCGCKGDCGKHCGCRRAGLHCSKGCKNCHGQDCQNIRVMTTEVINDDDGNEEDDEPILDHLESWNDVMTMNFSQDDEESDEKAHISDNDENSDDMEDHEDYTVDIDEPGCSNIATRAKRRKLQ